MLIILQGHKKWITSLAWEPAHLQSPSRRFASASKDGDVRIWDIVTRKCTVCLTGHTLAVTCIKWSGEGLIYSRYFLWQVLRWKSLNNIVCIYLFVWLSYTYVITCRNTWRNLRHYAYNLLFWNSSFPSQIIAFICHSSQDCTIKVWETTQGKLVRELKVLNHHDSLFFWSFKHFLLLFWSRTFRNLSRNLTQDFIVDLDTFIYSNAYVVYLQLPRNGNSLSCAFILWSGRFGHPSEKNLCCIPMFLYSQHICHILKTCMKWQLARPLESCHAHDANYTIGFLNWIKHHICTLSNSSILLQLLMHTEICFHALCKGNS